METNFQGSKKDKGLVPANIFQPAFSNRVFGASIILLEKKKTKKQRS